MQGRKLTTKALAVFLEQLRVNGNVTHAADAAGIGRATVYARRADDADFAAAWDDAVQEATDRLEAEAWRRAVDGVEEPVFGRIGKDRDGPVGVVRKYSDTLMITLLKAHKPEKYRERKDVQLNGDLTVKGYTTKDASPDAWDDDTTT